LRWGHFGILGHLFALARPPRVTPTFPMLGHNDARSDMDATAPPAADENDLDAPGLPDRLLRKAETAVLGRTSRILCVVERCTDEHNYSAVLRTAEALGVQHVWLVDPVVREADGGLGGGDTPEDLPGDDGAKRATKGRGRGRKRGAHGSDWREAHKLFARRAQEFTSIREFPDAASCVAALKADGRTIWATDLSQHAVPLTEPALRAATGVSPDESVVPSKLAIVFGTESVGCTETIFEACDLRVYLPLRGFADSLNLSVAAALVMNELFHLCPEAVGATAPEERTELREKWFTQLCAARALTGSEEKRRAKIEHTLAARRRLKGGSEDETTIDAKQKRDVPQDTSKDADDPDGVGDKNKAADAESTESLARELEALLEKRASAARAAAAPYIANPPKPLRDMRRSDEHREAFVGRKTRMRNAEHWAGMPAVGVTGSEPGAS
jgi:tRNA G18 (ribose-2'-O)-methylase SpoU